MLKKDIESASNLQKRILSFGSTDIIKNDIATYQFAPNEVSGDFLGIKQIKDDFYAILLLDVSGHGVTASMLTILIKSFFDMNAFRDEKPVLPSQFIKMLNLFFIEENFENGLFATILYSLYNNKTGEFLCSSAGSPPPIFYNHKTSEVSKIDIKGSIIGVSKDSEYENYSIKLSRNDILLMFTDGAYEVFDENNNMFGEDNILTTLKTVTNKNIKIILKTLSKALKSHAKGQILKDDISIMALRRTE